MLRLSDTIFSNKNFYVTSAQLLRDVLYRLLLWLCCTELIAIAFHICCLEVSKVNSGFIYGSCGSLRYNIVDSLEVHEKLKNDMLDSEEGNKPQWTVKGTKLLLELYKERKEKFRDPKIKKRNLWTQIVKEMDKNGYKYLTEDILDRKLRNLKKTFRTIKDNNQKNSTGRGRITWEYYDIFEEIFLDDRTINFRPTISSMDCAVHNPTQCSSSATSTILSPEVFIISPSTRLSASHELPRLSTRLSPVRTLHPALIRYVCHTPSKTFISVLMRTLTHSSDFFDSTFIGDSFIEENIINSFYSSSSSSSVIAEYSFSETESSSSVLLNSPEYINISTQRRKRNNSKETYNLRNQLLAVENKRVQMIAELKKSIDNSNKIQQERNELLKKIINKI